MKKENKAMNERGEQVEENARSVRARESNSYPAKGGVGIMQVELHISHDSYELQTTCIIQ